MNELLGKLTKLKTPVKAGVTLGAVVVVSLLYYFLLYADLDAEITSARASQVQLGNEKTQYEKRKKEYMAYREELRTLQEEQRELLKALPKRAEIPSFMATIQEQAELSGLEVVSITIDNELPEELYVKIPVRMEVRGGYHSLTKFFKNVAELRRIVNIENFSMIVERTETDSGPKLRARFVAATFRYVEKT